MSPREAPPGRSDPAGGTPWEERLEGGRREAWVRLSYALAAATGLLFLYLGLRPGGRGPILAFTWGRLVTFAGSALLLLFGLGWSLLRRPVLQRGRLGALLCLAAAVWFSAYPLAYPSSHEGHPSSVSLRLPFDGEWTVRWGGAKGPENTLVLEPDRRFGYVFVITDAEGRSQVGERSLCRGADVLAPASGVVALVHDGEPDAPFGGIPRGAEPFGNHVVLEVLPEEFLFLIGLEQGSIEVRAGERVQAGARIGRVGFSARSQLTPEAHLGLHLADRPEPRRGEGIPCAFRGYQSSGRGLEAGVPLGGLRDGRHVGERVQHAP